MSGLITFPRRRLTAATTFYVRSDGNDNNNGLADTAQGAFLTLQKAADVVSDLDMSDKQVTIQVGDATYSAGVQLRRYVGTKPPILQGNTGTPANCVLSVASGSAVMATERSAAGRWDVKGFTLAAAAGAAVEANAGGLIELYNIRFGASSIHVQAANGGLVRMATNYDIVGAANWHALIEAGGLWLPLGRTVTLTGTPAFAQQFVQALMGGNVDARSMTFSGSATGVRYSVNPGGLIRTGGGGANYFPGNSAGDSTNGTYN